MVVMDVEEKGTLQVPTSFSMAIMHIPYVPVESQSASGCVQWNHWSVCHYEQRSKQVIILGSANGQQ